MNQPKPSRLTSVEVGTQPPGARETKIELVEAKAPLLSVGLPVYNGGRSLRRAVDSILQQDLADWELVICDNASTDDTVAISREYAARDPRIRLVCNPTNIGAAPNHNKVFALARGKYFNWAAHDVEYAPGMLRACVDTLVAAGPRVALAYPQCEMIDASRAYSELELYSIDARDKRPSRRVATVINRLTWVNQLYGVIPSDTLRKTRLMDSFASSDYVLLAELAMLGELWELPRVLMRRNLEPKRPDEKPWSMAEWTQWTDPRPKRRTWLSNREALAREYIRSALRMPMAPVDRLRCAVVAPTVYYRRVFLRKIGVWQKQMRATSR